MTITLFDNLDRYCELHSIFTFHRQIQRSLHQTAGIICSSSANDTASNGIELKRNPIIKKRRSRYLSCLHRWIISSVITQKMSLRQKIRSGKIVIEKKE